MSTKDLSKMTVVQLREQLRSRGLPTDGTKAALIERLKASYAAEDTILNSDATALKDSIAAALSSASAITPSVHIVRKSKTIQKVEVNKKTEAMIHSFDAKLKRAQRFGLPLSDEQMKQKRAERFGMQLGAAANIGEILAEKKKRRAERFGIISETEKMQEILNKRARRFGVVNKSSAVVADKVEKASLEVLEKRGKRFGLCSEEAELEIKKQRRAERFGLNK
uniref:SAP domain-containing protein n=1 Tax=Wuchereria bancrofti TaxID=6293 RepID=A0A1I8E978_WUCBA